MRFSRKTIEGIKYYVYGLRYPETEIYFYIGKGKGNRVFSHVNQSVKRGIKDPKFDVINSLRERGGPEIDIIRHGLTEHQALLLESSLIDVLRVNQLTNKVRGIDSNKYGLMSPKNVEANFKGKEFKLKIPAVCFKINRAWSKNMTKEQLYNSVRGTWYLSLSRASKAEYGLGLCYGIIRGIYKIEGWETDYERSPIRHRFYGFEAQELQKYLGYNMLNHPGHKVRGPLFYNEC